VSEVSRQVAQDERDLRAVARLAHAPTISNASDSARSSADAIAVCAVCTLGARDDLRFVVDADVVSVTNESGTVGAGDAKGRPHRLVVRSQIRWTCLSKLEKVNFKRTPKELIQSSSIA
jgi:hypothetical protein